MGPRFPSFPVFWSFGGFWRFFRFKTGKNLNAGLLMKGLNLGSRPPPNTVASFMFGSSSGLNEILTQNMFRLSSGFLTYNQGCWSDPIFSIYLFINNVILYLDIKTQLPYCSLYYRDYH